MFLDVGEKSGSRDRLGCLVDIDTGTIALYIYLD